MRYSTQSRCPEPAAQCSAVHPCASTAARSRSSFSCKNARSPVVAASSTSACCGVVFLRTIFKAAFLCCGALVALRAERVKSYAPSGLLRVLGSREHVFLQRDERCGPHKPIAVKHVALLVSHRPLARTNAARAEGSRRDGYLRREAASRATGPPLASVRRPAAAARGTFGLRRPCEGHVALGPAGEAFSPRVARS